MPFDFAQAEQRNKKADDGHAFASEIQLISLSVDKLKDTMSTKHDPQFFLTRMTSIILLC